MLAWRFVIGLRSLHIFSRAMLVSGRVVFRRIFFCNIGTEPKISFDDISASSRRYVLKLREVNKAT